MKPVLLKIKGLNSFIEEQSVDFDKLTEAGLFGIFGPTGSGKSTILDAMTLALYGRVHRAGGGTSGIINSQSDFTKVYFEFTIGAGTERKRYFIQRRLKKHINKKNGSESIKTEEALLCDISEPDNMQVIRQGQRDVNAGVEEIIGLSAEDFTRSVVLPQGNFSEFLKLNGRERREMLERIFSLEKYGEEMTMRINRLKAGRYIEQNRLEEALNIYGDINREGLKELQSELEEKKKLCSELIKALEKSEQDYQQYRQIWQWQQELETYRDEELRLRAEEDVYSNRKDKLVRGEQAVLLKEEIESLRKKDQEFKEKQDLLNSLASEMQEMNLKLEQDRKKWQMASSRKDQELPKLLSRKLELAQAVQIEKSLPELEQEIVLLQDEYGQLLKLKDEKKKQCFKTQQQLQQYREQLQQSKVRKALLRIDPEQRETISRAYQEEKTYFNYLEDLKERSLTFRKQQTACQEADSVLDKIAIKRKAKEEEFSKLTQRSEQLQINCPGTPKELLQKQQEIYEWGSELMQMQGIVEQVEKIAIEIDAYAANKNNEEKELGIERKKLAGIEAQYNAVEEKIHSQRTQNMAAFLAKELEEGQSCPVCGSGHHPRVAEAIDSDQVQELEEQKESLKKQKEQSRELLYQKDMQFQQIDREIQRLVKERDKYLAKVDPKELRSQQDVYRKMETDFAELQKDIADWEKELKGIKDEMEQLDQELSRIKKDENKWERDCSKEHSLLQSIEDEKNRSEQKLSEVRKSYSIYQAELGMDNFAQKYQDIQQMDRELLDLEKRDKDLAQLLDIIEKERDSLQDELAKLELGKAQREENYRGKGEIIKQRKAELQNLSRGENAAEAFQQVEKTIKQVEEDYKHFTSCYEEEKLAKDGLSLSYSETLADKNALEKLLIDSNKQVNKRLMECGFSDIDEAIAAYIPADKVEELREMVKQYENQLLLNRAGIEQLSLKIGDKNISAERWQYIQELRKDLQEKTAEQKEKILLLTAEEKEMERRLKEKEEIGKRKKELDRQYGLLIEVENLFRGKKFVEYIARTRLNYIAKDASVKLKQISRGRYALELNSEGEFVMRDDFNGGSRRPTHTLSGGETFLTSLALALALSSNIQLGKASLEFFFLDEGFGSLDTEALDIVMDSLERLHSESVSVGLISHVEELKQRIPRKLIVDPPLPGLQGSRLRLEEN